MIRLRHTLCALGFALAAGPLAAQEPAPAEPPAEAAVPGTDAEPRLVFEREVFAYPASTRRDPFRPLTSADSGPLFQDLQLRMILFSRQNPGRSVALIQDGARKTHRLRRGDAVGSATVVDIGPRRVLFSVVEFGVRRQEVLELKPTTREGA
ncbi:MAG TPA: hypothetical protein VK939_00325 [Longimicrobiales bacterium]|nr:hypothetical protein [Longimicrobiales bacterium]